MLKIKDRHTLKAISARSRGPIVLLGLLVFGITGASAQINCKQLPTIACNSVASGTIGQLGIYTSSTEIGGLTIGTGIATALGVNIGSAGAPVLFNGALGTPSSGIATNLTGTASGLTAGRVTTNANLTGDVTSSGNATTLATVNSGPGSVGSSTAIPILTTNGKGLVTGQTTAAVIAPAGTLTGTALASGVTSAPGLLSAAGGSFGTAAYVNINSALPSATTSQLYGGTGAAGAASAVSVGSGLSLSGGTLTATAGTIQNVSGSAALTTGTITASTSSLALAAAQDFVNGQGILVEHAGPTFTASPPTSITVAPQGTAGSTTYTYKLSCVDTAGGVGAATSGTATSTGNAALSPTNNNLISFTGGSGCSGVAVYRNNVLVGVTNGTTFSDAGGAFLSRPTCAAITGVSYNIPSSPPSVALNDYLLTTITSGGGTTTLVLGANATNSVTGATVIHDDTAALQAYINTFPTATSATATLPPGCFNISSTLTLGNGTSWTSHSTQNGVVLSGAGATGGNFLTSNWTTTSPTTLSWVGGAAYSAMVEVSGLMAGWGVDNINLNCNDYTSLGLLVYDGIYGHHNGLATFACEYAKIETTYGTNAAGESSIGNTATGTTIDGKGNSVWYGMQFTSGLTGTDSYGGNYNRTTINGITSNARGITGISLGNADNMMFYGTIIGGMIGSVQFNYSSTPGWPASNMFFGLDPESGTITNSGTPSGAATNVIVGLSKTNGATCPTLANLTCQ